MLATHQLTKRYGPVSALENCSLEIAAGEVFGLLGPNGAGKTTLIRLLLGFQRPTAGRAEIAGRDVLRETVQVHRLVSYLPGEVRLFRRWRGRDVLSMLGGLRGQRDASRAIQLAERLDVDLSRKVSACSSGMRQKLALAAVLAADTPVVILDEPTTHLDPTARREVLQLVRETQAAGRTVVFSAHVLSEVEAVCDRVAILRKGTLVHTEVLSELRKQHRIEAVLSGPLPPVPEHLQAGGAAIVQRDERLQLEVPGQLTPWLGWLATLPLEEVRIEPVGLASVYDRFHGHGVAEPRQPASDPPGD